MPAHLSLRKQWILLPLKTSLLYPCFLPPEVRGARRIGREEGDCQRMILGVNKSDLVVIVNGNVFWSYVGEYLAGV